MTQLNEIRSSFLDFFEKNDHRVVPSSPLIPHNDPTLMFVNAGMVPFKNYFIGNETPENKRAVSSQRCVRAGGKHNDLDNVGHTARHLTFFEMLGNFSFGDYFKEKAISLAWDLLIKEYSIPKEKLLITIYKEDEEAGEIWKKISGFSDNKIIKISTDDNFWSMGEEGPCGPCSEIFFDHGDSVQGGPPGSKDEDGDRFVEIWNLVFMQFLKKSNSEKVDLPKPSIDTGMGLERISTVLQGKINSFDTDLFLSLVDGIEDQICIKANDNNIANFRVIADHLRSISFLIADGVLPSNDGRGYVLRRIMRRAMRHNHLLGIKDPILFKLSDLVINLMYKSYPELVRAKELIRLTLFNEEEKFLSTLSKGIKILNDESKSLKPGDIFDGSSAFKLYDTYGFPLDLTEDLLRDKELKLDKKSFNIAMQKQRDDARKSWLGSGQKKTEEIWFDVSDISKPTEFLGYVENESMGEVSAIIIDGKISKKISEGDEGAIVLNQTPFYAESGGQLGDEGLIFSNNVNFIVTDTKKKINGVYAHFGKLIKGNIFNGDVLNLKIDTDNRKKIMANHSATHLLHEALRRVLGPHVTQKGSQVSSQKLRFDFSHPKALTKEELQNVELKINQLILEDSSVMTEVLPYEEAIKKGALALFGEKYDDEVRVLSMGNDSFSVELCGGTHVKSLNDIGLFKLISQSSVASGIRRIEAKTGDEASSSISIIEKMSFDSQNKEKKSNKNKAEKISKSILNGKILDINDIKFYHDILEDIDGKNLRSLIDECKKDIGSGIICLISRDNKKATIAIGVTNDLLDIFDSVQLVRIASEKMSGKGGGGRPDMALSGGSEPNKAEEAIEVLIKKIKEKN
ncbi:MAG: alanine--tRNA ligase [alpha proteobacterium MED-G09]|nr:MAG: alanine--tRNA ligase [alpha proteobacterium MED-G09]|tara:strand:- start:3898 stop:6462 length:2565 start_codon:yes stop_codon:yes gene_type:complete